MISQLPSVSSIPKFVGPGKSLKVNSHIRLLEALGANFPVKHAGGATLHDFKPQYEGNDAGFKRFHPEVYAASLLVKVVRREQYYTPVTTGITAGSSSSSSSSNSTSSSSSSSSSSS